MNFNKINRDDFNKTAQLTVTIWSWHKEDYKSFDLLENDILDRYDTAEAIFSFGIDSYLMRNEGLWRTIQTEAIYNNHALDSIDFDVCFSSHFSYKDMAKVKKYFEGMAKLYERTDRTYVTRWDSTIACSYHGLVIAICEAILFELESDERF